MKEFEIAIRYENGETDEHYIYDRTSKHWETDAESVDEFIEELISLSDDESNVAYDVKQITLNSNAEIYAYEVTEKDFNRWEATEITKEMFE